MQQDVSKQDESMRRKACCKVGHFNTEVNKDPVASEVSPLVVTQGTFLYFCTEIDAKKNGCCPLMERLDRSAVILVRDVKVPCKSDVFDEFPPPSRWLQTKWQGYDIPSGGEWAVTSDK